MGTVIVQRDDFAPDEDFTERDINQVTGSLNSLNSRLVFAATPELWQPVPVNPSSRKRSLQAPNSWKQRFGIFFPGNAITRATLDVPALDRYVPSIEDELVLSFDWMVNKEGEVGSDPIGSVEWALGVFIERTGMSMTETPPSLSVPITETIADVLAQVKYRTTISVPVLGDSGQTIQTALGSSAPEGYVESVGGEWSNILNEDDVLTLQLTRNQLTDNQITDDVVLLYGKGRLGGLSSVQTPNMVRDLRVLQSMGDITLQWEVPFAPPDTSSYFVERDGRAGTGTLSGTTYRETGLVSGTTYRYGVYAVNSAGRRGFPMFVEVVVQ